jgi:twitching motility protein PilT
MDLNDLLKQSSEKRASDVHLKVGVPPVLRIDGHLTALQEAGRMSREWMVETLYGIMTPHQKEQFSKVHDLDMAYSVPGLGRFRVNIYQQRGTVGAVFRVIPMKVLTIRDLNLPPVIESIALEPRGLILVTGTTGSGKSTTLASIVDYINSNRNVHIMTIEDPIEYLHRDRMSLLHQREVGFDTISFSSALRHALRQDPDVIMVGEMRDHETIETALTAAETGHLVMSTLHTSDATETINRVISVFPPHQQPQVRIQLATVIEGIISMRLVPRADGRGRIPAIEICVATQIIRELILDKDRTKEINKHIGEGLSQYGMQTFDQSLMVLYKKELITYEEALKQSTSPDDFALKVGGIESLDDLTWEGEREVAAPSSSRRRDPGKSEGSLDIDRFAK